VVEVPGLSSGRGGWDESDARLPWRATRRALLAGGAVALLAAGCGEEDEVVAAPADALLRQLAAERDLVAATSSLPGGALRSAVPMLREINTRARERARRLAAAVAAEGGRPHDAPQPAAARVAAGEAVARAEAAIVAHVVALPDLPGRELRELGAAMVAGAAGDTALLADALGVPMHNAFPGTPT
jgi:hypothetical protein